MSYPYCELGPSFCFAPVFNMLTMKNINKYQRRYVPFMLSDTILTQWWSPVASSEALDLLYWTMCTVTYRCIAMAIKMSSKVGVFFHCCLFACRLGGHWGITEWVVDRWWRPGASSVPAVLLQYPRMAINVACNGGTFVCRLCLLVWCTPGWDKNVLNITF